MASSSAPVGLRITHPTSFQTASGRIGGRECRDCPAGPAVARSTPSPRSNRCLRRSVDAHDAGRSLRRIDAWTSGGRRLGARIPRRRPVPRRRARSVGRPSAERDDDVDRRMGNAIGVRPKGRAAGSTNDLPRSVKRLVGSRRLYQPVSQRERHGLELGVDTELAHDVLDVRPERVRGDEQPFADLRRGEPFR